MAAFKEIHIDQTGQRRNMWDFFPPVGTTPQDIETPENWTHLANAPRHKRIAPRDLVFVEPADGAWFAIFRVLTVNAGGARLRMLPGTLDQAEAAPREAPDQATRAKYEIHYIPAHNGFRIKRLSDNAVLQTGVESKAAAEAWVIANDGKALAA